MCGLSRTPPTGDLARNPGMCPDCESSKRPFGSQANTQSTKPHYPGLAKFRKRKKISFSFSGHPQLEVLGG